MGNKESKAGSNDVAGMAAFDDWLNKRLTKYFEDMEVAVLDMKVGPEARKDIIEAVEEMVVKMCHDVTKIEGRLKIKKSGITKIGHFFEDTEIICLDEIEIYLVLENLSGEGNIFVENTTNEYFETLQVCVREKNMSVWEDVISKESDKRGLIVGNKLVTRVYDVMSDVVQNIMSSGQEIVYKKHGYLELMNDPGISKRGSGISLKFGWTGSIFFSVILTPVLKVTDVETYIPYKEALTEMIYDAVNHVGSLLLVPDVGPESGDYFRLSLAHTECYLMNRHISASHRRVYQVLRFLVNGYKKKETCDSQLINTEQLKTFLIMHDMVCGKKDAIGPCVMDVIDKVEEFLKGMQRENGKLFLSSVFMEPMNVYRRSVASLGNDMVDLNLKAILTMKQHLINDVGRVSNYVFRDVVSRLVPVNQFLLNADYHARKSRVNLAEEK